MTRSCRSSHKASAWAQGFLNGKLSAWDGHGNRLAGSTSPYLLQHASNPVDWYPWGDAAFAAARERDVADLPVGGVRRVPLVPRDGARVVRGRRHGGVPERAFRRDQGRPRRAAGRRRHLHDGRAGDDRPGGLADVGVPDPERRSRSGRRRTCRTRRGTGCRRSARCSRGSPRRGATRRDEVEAQGAAVDGRHRPRRFDRRRRNRARRPEWRSRSASAQAFDERVGRVRRRAEVPADHRARVAAAADASRGDADCGAHARAHARRDGRRRHPRSDRRRASRATAPTRRGTSRTSRRCCTTTHSC